MNRKLLPVLLLAAGCATAQAIFTDAQVACEGLALAQSVIPTGTPVATVAADLELACDIAVSLDKDVQAVVAAYEAGQASSGTAPAASASYTPGPLITNAKMHKAKPPAD
jgi:hypothetical protein